MRGDGEEDGQGDEEGGDLAPLFVLSPPTQPHCINGAARIPHAALFSLSHHPLLSPLLLFLIILYVLLKLNMICFFYINCDLKSV
jgi:hypothetical protein